MTHLSGAQMTDTQTQHYGEGDNTYQALGALKGITQLVDRFYDLMDQRQDALELRQMHPKNLTKSRKKLVYFLSGWTGGPEIYSETFGNTSLPQAHARFNVTESSMKAWLACMDQALKELDYPDALRQYLIEKLSVPAQAMRLMTEYKQKLATQPNTGFKAL
jgi:hemoglobin